VCDRCMHLEDSPERLKQHAQALQKPRRRQNQVKAAVGNISLFTPLDPTSDFQPRDPLKQFTIPPSADIRLPSTFAARRQPAWMSLLPSNVNSGIQSPSDSTVQRRLTSPSPPPTHFFTPDSTGIATPLAPDQALALSTAVQGIEEERRRVSAPATYIPQRSASTPKSWAVPGKQNRRHLRLDRETPIPDFRNLTPSLHEPHTRRTSVARTTTPSTVEESTSSRRASFSSLRLPKRRAVIKFFPSTATEHGSCGETQPHTPMPDQTISPATKPPFFRELSSFFGNRVGKFILPSRVTESRASNTSNNTTTTSTTNTTNASTSTIVAGQEISSEGRVKFEIHSCSICGAEVRWDNEQSLRLGSVRKANAVLGEVLCESCKWSEFVPGGYS
jgi:hypothetical protein